MKTCSILLPVLVAGGILAAQAAEPPMPGDVADRHSLTLQGARRAADAALVFATSNGAAPSIAIVDEGGHLLYFARPETSFVAGANVALGKARTAALFKKPTAVLEDTVNQGRFSMTALADFTPLQGGVPIVHDGQVIGAIGVSGAKSAAQDEEIAKAGVAVFETKTGPSLGRPASH